MQLTPSAITCSNSTIETLETIETMEQAVKYVQS